MNLSTLTSVVAIILLLNNSVNNNIKTVRNLYLKAYISKSDCVEFGDKLTIIKDEKPILFKGYQGCYYFMKCKFIDNSIDKLIYFHKGRNLLESAIKESPRSVELRFLRYTIQKNLPKFLLYNENIAKDLTFVTNNIKDISDNETQIFITSSLKSMKQ